MEPTKVGIREFRAGLADYIAAAKPVAVTRHGQTVGFFIPTQGPSDADMAALKKAWDQLDQMLASKGIDAEKLVSDFESVRAADAASRRAQRKRS